MSNGVVRRARGVWNVERGGLGPSEPLRGSASRSPSSNAKATSRGCRNSRRCSGQRGGWVDAVILETTASCPHTSAHTRRPGIMRSIQWGTARHGLSEVTEHDVRIYLWSFRAGSKTTPSHGCHYLLSRIFFTCTSVLVVLLATSHACAYVCGCALSASCDSVRYGHLID